MSHPEPEDILDKVDAGLAKAESFVLVLTLAAMVGLSALQLFLRKFFDFGFEWADILVRQMVLWIGFVGGALATYQSRHIAIDAVTKLLTPKKAAILRAFTSLVAAGVTSVMVWAAWVYLKGEMETDAEFMGGIPAWPIKAIVPIDLVLITFHFLVGARNQILIAAGRRTSPEELVEHSQVDVEVVR
ncbi:MAG: TRAP transporter small permease [Myxococcales bacterium]|nr:TRAP transporter small permease [Myxococcales bacterium]MCB9651886.1 TRAP transporter small permease [Deltaproteobacteria bacterium]